MVLVIIWMVLVGDFYVMIGEEVGVLFWYVVDQMQINVFVDVIKDY